MLSLWLLFLVFAHGSSKHLKDGNVYVLSEDDFDVFLKENPTTLVKFYAPWCGHCKTLAPEYEKAAKKLKIPLAKVDATTEVKLGKRFNVEGYPTLKFFHDGKDPIDYEGQRDAESIEQWVKKKMDPSYKPPPEEVVTLTMETFEEFSKDKPLMLVEFYAPWCGHCKKLAPEYEKAAKRLKSHNIPLAKVDATVEKFLSDKFGITGYPTLKILRYGRRFDYEGPREADGIVNFMLDQSQPAAKELRTVSEAKKFFSKDDITIIGFFASAESPQFEAFQDAGERTRSEFQFVGYTTDPSVFKHFEAVPNDVIIFYPELFLSDVEDKQKKLNSPNFSTEDLLSFWRENSATLVGLRTMKNVATKFARNPLVVVYYSADFSPEYRKGSQYWRQKIVPIAKKYFRQKFRFAVSHEDEFARELQEVGLGDSGLEHNVICFGFDGKKYPMRPEIYDEELEENLEAFMKDISAGKVKPYVKSAPVPKDDKGPIKTLVASNFENVLGDKSKDYLIEFYAPWCGHCKKFESKYIELANKLKGEKSLVLAQFDATANDPHDDFKVEGFPTIYFAPGGLERKPVKYSGNRDINDLIGFMKKHSVNSFKTKEEL